MKLFNKNDKIKCIDDTTYPNITIGNIYTVEKCKEDLEGNHISIEEFNNNYYYPENLFVLAIETLTVNNFNISRLSEKEQKLLQNLVLKAITSIEAKVWIPKFDDKYWTIGVSGIPELKRWVNAPSDQYALASNLIFRTEEEAKSEIFKRNIKAKLEIFALENNDKIDWDKRKKSYYLYYYRLINNIEVGTNDSYQTEGTTYFSSKKIAEEAIQFIGKDNLIRYFKGV